MKATMMTRPIRSPLITTAAVLTGVESTRNKMNVNIITSYDKTMSSLNIHLKSEVFWRRFTYGKLIAICFISCCANRFTVSDVKKDLRLKANAKTKDLDPKANFKAKVKPKDLSAKDLSVKDLSVKDLSANAKAKAKDLSANDKANTKDVDPKAKFKVKAKDLSAKAKAKDLDPETKARIKAKDLSAKAKAEYSRC